jgi:uncharacterized protein
VPLTSTLKKEGIDVENITPPLIGGLLIGLSASLMMLLYGRITGISSMIQNIITRQTGAGYNSSVFLLGMILGSLILSLSHDINIQPKASNPLLIILSGLLVGYGTSLGSGCTSGHGICGLSRFSLRSLVATLTFMGSGIMTVYLVRHVL